MRALHALRGQFAVQVTLDLTVCMWCDECVAASS